jgi:S-formylglutathione hydrolase FrmB
MKAPAMDGRARPLVAGALLALLSSNLLQAADLDRLNASLAGHVLDLTHNHGSDRRFYSESLGLERDMYVYLPPGYDSAKSYPLFLWIHGFGGGEQQFTRQVVRALDESIVSGAMPPVIAVCPDCSVPSSWKPWYQGSWCINGPQGRWEDYVVDDVMRFVSSQFKIRPERDAHVISGWSMGGFAAYNLSFKHPDQFRLVVGIYPNLNIRYADKAGHWGTNFDSDNCGWLPLEGLRWAHYLGRYPKPWRFPIPCGVVYWPAWGHDEAALDRMSQENPCEQVDRLDIRDGQFDLFIAYGRQDEYNVDAQVDSFLHKARERHLNIWVRYDPEGHHSSPYVNKCMPDVFVAVGERLRERLPDLTQHAAGDRIVKH